MEILTCPAYIVSKIVDLLETKGWDRAKLLATVDLSEDLLKEDNARISRSSYMRFTEYVGTKLQDESMGMMKEPMKPGTFAMLCKACINCNSLGHFLSRASTFSEMTNGCIEMKLSRDGDTTTYSINAVPGMLHLEDIYIWMVLAIMHRLSSWAIGQGIVLQSVDICGDRPAYGNDYTLLFACPINFQQPQNCLRFYTGYLDKTIIQNEMTLKEFLFNSQSQLMSELEFDSSLTFQIRDLIKKHDDCDFPRFDEVASSLNISVPTLRRRLQAEGTTYQHIKDEVRRDLAIFYLSQKPMSVDEVALRTGFTEPTSFYRAFKRWTGASPRIYTGATPDNQKSR